MSETAFKPGQKVRVTANNAGGPHPTEGRILSPGDVIVVVEYLAPYDAKKQSFSAAVVRYRNEHTGGLNWMFVRDLVVDGCVCDIMTSGCTCGEFQRERSLTPDVEDDIVGKWGWPKDD